MGSDIAERLEVIDEAWRLQAPELKSLLPEVVEGFQRWRNAPETRKTHLFGGRYENIYIERESLPALEPVLDLAVAAAQTILGGGASLRVGFWFNEMPPGSETTLHTHDDSDELLSGVFYVAAPEASGDLLLGPPGRQRSLAPIESAFVFFSPALPHAVGRNESESLRLSIGMNFGRHDAPRPDGFGAQPS